MTDVLDTTLADSLIATLPCARSGLFNPWKDSCIHDSIENTPASKRDRLARHLNCDAEFLLLGEAPGFQGCRYSGIAFTSERLLGEGAIPRVPALPHRLTTRHRPFSEPSATIVWKTLYRLGIAQRTILWNALQLHPYRSDTPWSNRTPTSEEVALGAPAIRLLIAAFPTAKIVAVGKKSQGLLADMGLSTIATVRHPANGGATAFANGLETLTKNP